MHELSLCGSIYEIVERRANGRRVSLIHLRIGQLRQVIPDTLTYCWSMVCADTDLADSQLSVESVPLRLRCGDCGGQSTPAPVLLMLCSHCGGTAVQVVTGDEFLLTSLELAEA